ncbi:hypothetical protein PUT24_23975 [Streptomyces sp. SP17KL33]|nr:hypothetical protein [Streptomyces sp. SP17KL33]MEE1833874.1 hypothetical protein [Streptomyces sp. SP17KL33]
MRKNATAITTSAPTAPARNIVTRRLGPESPPSERPPPPGGGPKTPEGAEASPAARPPPAPEAPAGPRDDDADDTEAGPEAAPEEAPEETDDERPPARADGEDGEDADAEDGEAEDGEADGEDGDDGGAAPQLTRDAPPATAPAPPTPPYGGAEEDTEGAEGADGDEVEGVAELPYDEPPYGEREARSLGERGCGGTVGETPAGPATPGVAVALRPALPFLPPPLTVDWPPVSPRAARAWEIRIASMVMSWRISERLQARSASSHMVVRWTGSVPVTSANATIAPFGASSLPLRYRSQDVLL